MRRVTMGSGSFRLAECRMGDWKWRLWIGGAWLLRAGVVRQCWPYRYYHLCVGPVQITLKYAPQCRICLSDEYVVYPGKYCDRCRVTVDALSLLPREAA